MDSDKGKGNFKSDLEKEQKSVEVLINIGVTVLPMDEKDHKEGKGDIKIKTCEGWLNTELKNTLYLKTRYADSVCVEIANTSNLEDPRGWYQKSSPDLICFTSSDYNIAYFWKWERFKKSVDMWLNSEDCVVRANAEPKHSFPPYATGAIITFVPLTRLCKPDSIRHINIKDINE